MPKLQTLVKKLSADYPDLCFKSGERFAFHAPSTIEYCAGSPLDLLHELGHYLLGREEYLYDIDLMRIESEAWAKAKELCAQYHVAWNEDFVQDQLDTYRDWLHTNSACPICGLSGYQDNNQIYHCPLCSNTWASKIRPE